MDAIVIAELVVDFVFAQITCECFYVSLVVSRRISEGPGRICSVLLPMDSFDWFLSQAYLGNDHLKGKQMN